MTIFTPKEHGSYLYIKTVTNLLNERKMRKIIQFFINFYHVFIILPFYYFNIGSLHRYRWWTHQIEPLVSCIYPQDFFYKMECKSYGLEYFPRFMYHFARFFAWRWFYFMEKLMQENDSNKEQKV
jgi:hypothetical protein